MKHCVALWALLLGTLAWAALGQTTDVQVGLVVGRVSGQDARVLYWAYVPEDMRASGPLPLCSVSAFPPVTSMSVKMVQLSETPQVLSISVLDPDRTYTIRFHCNEDPDAIPAEPVHTVQFTTSSIPPSPSPSDLFFLSCNRLAEETDTEMWQRLAQVRSEHSTPGAITIHLGDQVYADEVTKLPTHQNCVTYKDLLRSYRSMYTRTWNNPIMRSILRNGSHIMLLDDHDIVNNLSWRHRRGTDAWKQALFRAGFQTFLEFQYQLRDYIPPLSFIEKAPEANCCIYPTLGEGSCASSEWKEFDDLLDGLKLWGSMRMGDTGMIWLDTRGDRALHDDVPFLSAEQLDYVGEQLKHYDSVEEIKQIVFTSSIPLLYHSTLMAQVAYLAEQEEYTAHPNLLNATARLFDVLFTYPNKINLVGGDVHMWFNSTICRRSDGQCIRQRITSGMTPKSATLHSAHLYLYNFFVIHVFGTELLSPRDTYDLAIEEVFLENNFVFYDAEGWHVELRNLTDDPLPQALQNVFSFPFVFYFVALSFASNVTFGVFILLRCCLARGKVKQD